MKTAVPIEIEEHRDRAWRREGAAQVESAFEAERFIERVGFASCLTDSRRPGPSLYVAVCGRRDAVMPRNVQKDPEASRTWRLKDELVGRGKVYYAKLSRGKAMFLAPRMIPYFHAIMGVRRSEEPHATQPRTRRALLRVLRREWEMGTADLRDESGVKDRASIHAGTRRTAGGHAGGARARCTTNRRSPTSTHSRWVVSRRGFAHALDARSPCARLPAAFSTARA